MSGERRLLSRTQKQVLAALADPESGCWLSRYELGQARGAPGGVHLRTMIILRDFGLVVTKSQDTFMAVLQGECRCGCDRWTITEIGLEFAKMLNIVKVGGEV